MQNFYDVIIVGGGPAGLSLTAMLAARGLTVACLDREQPARQLRPAFDGRTTALAAATRDALDHAGVWPYLAREACPILDIRVTDEGAPRKLHFDHREAGSPFGWIVENRHLRRALYRRVEASPRAALFSGAEVTGIAVRPEAAEVSGKRAGKNFKLRGALIIGADGRHSFCRRNAGIGWRGRNYPQSALVCTIRHDKPHHNAAVEDFLPGGPLASLPMTGQRSSIVWSMPRDGAALLQTMPEPEFCALLERHLRPMLGTIALEGPRFLYPLSIYHADKYAAPRLALVGEAAHVMHPIAGQGLNLSMRDNRRLADMLLEAKRLGLDLGGRELLERYARMRRPDNLLMLAATDGIDRLFSNAVPGLGLARQWGLALVDSMPALKRFFMQAAMGNWALERP